MTPAFFACLLALQGATPPRQLPSLSPGTTAGLIENSDPAFSTPTLAELSSRSTVLADGYRLDLPAGTWTLELVSPAFDAYLVIQDAEGGLVAEDDDGFFRTHSRVSLEVSDGAPLIAYACALHDGRGHYELRTYPGPPRELALEEHTPRELEVLEGWVARAKASFGEESLEHAQALHHLGIALVDVHGTRAVDLLHRAITLHEDVGDPEEAELAMAQLASALWRTGDPENALLWARRASDAQPDHPVMAHNAGMFALQFPEGAWTASGEDPFDIAARYLERAVNALRTYPDPDPEMILGTPGVLDQALRLSGQWDRFLEAYPDTRVLAAGDVVEGEIEAHHFNQRTATMRGGYSSGRPHTVAHRVRVAESGWYTFELRSFYFDSYLVLRDLSGRVLAEDDDGRGTGGDAQISIRLDADSDFLLEATALHGRLGNYSVRVLAGSAADRTAAEQEALEREIVLEKERFIEDWQGPEERVLLSVIDNLIRVYGFRGRNEDALAMSRRSLAIRERLFGPDSTEVATGLAAVASELSALGRSAEALPLLERSVGIRRALQPEAFATTASEVRLGNLLVALGDYERAEPLLVHGLAEHERRGVSDLNMGGVLHAMTRLRSAQGRFDEAIEHAERLVAIQRRIEGTSRGSAHLLGDTLSRLARIHSYAGNLEAARAAAEEAFEIAVRERGEHAATAARRRLALAGIMDRQGDYGEAYALWTDAQRRIEEALGRNSFEASRGVVAGARMLVNLGRGVEAAEALWGSVERQADHEDALFSVLPESLRLRRLRSGAGALNLLLSLDPGEVRRDLYMPALRWKGRVSRSLLESRSRAMRNVDAATAAELEELRAVQAELSAAFFADDAPADPEGRRLEELRARRVALESALARKGGDVETDRVASTAELAGALPEDTVLVDFVAYTRFQPARRGENGEVLELAFDGAPQLDAWIVRPGDERVRRVPLGPLPSIEPAVGELLGQLVPLQAAPLRGIGIPAADPSDANDRLRALVWDPISDHVAGAERIVISPHGSLGTLPFEVLRLPDGAHLIEHHAFAYVQDAASLLDRGRPPARTAEGLLAVGNVDYDGRGDVAALPDPQPPEAPQLRGPRESSWPSLRFTGAEAAVVVEAFATLDGADGATGLLVGVEASEENLKRGLAGKRYVHIATHGFFQPEETVSMWDELNSEPRAEMQGHEITATVAGLFPGLLSGLVCAGANLPLVAGREDGLLTAEEVTWLDLEGCELVTLSACQTALGTAKGGEGLLGLRRAFRLAGARTVVASLWSVGDEETSLLMRDFYRYLWVDGRPKGDALRSAQLDMLRRHRSANRESTLPATWGAFVLAGDWD